MLTEFGIDPNDVISVSNIYSDFDDRKLLYGTVMKYVSSALGRDIICIMLVGGWSKQYIVDYKKIGTVVDDMKSNGFTERQIESILN